MGSVGIPEGESFHQVANTLAEAGVFQLSIGEHGSPRPSLRTHFYGLSLGQLPHVSTYALLVVLVGWLILAVSAFAARGLNWKTSLRHALIWAVIITGLMLLVTMVR